MGWILLIFSLRGSVERRATSEKAAVRVLTGVISVGLREFFPPFLRLSASLGQQTAFGDDQVDQGKQRVELGRVLGQAPVAVLR